MPHPSAEAAAQGAPAGWRAASQRPTGAGSGMLQPQALSQSAPCTSSAAGPPPARRMHQIFTSASDARAQVQRGTIRATLHTITSGNSYDCWYSHEEKYATTHRCLAYLCNQALHDVAGGKRMRHKGSISQHYGLLERPAPAAAALCCRPQTSGRCHGLSARRRSG